MGCILGNVFQDKKKTKYKISETIHMLFQTCSQTIRPRVIKKGLKSNDFSFQLEGLDKYETKSLTY